MRSLRRLAIHCPIIFAALSGKTFAFYLVNTNEKNVRDGPFANLKNILLRPFLKRNLRFPSVMLKSRE
jgi:hypothetical protein